MPLKITFWLSLVWSLVVASHYLLLLINAPTTYRATLLGLALCFVISSIAALQRHRWAVLLSMLFTIALAIRWLPMVVVNYWLYLTREPLYLDSPATIQLVHPKAALFAVPAVILLILYVCQWQRIGGWLKSPRTAAQLFNQVDR